MSKLQSPPRRGGKITADAREHLAYRHSQYGVSQIVERGGLRVHDDDARAGSFRGRDGAGDGIYLQA